MFKALKVCANKFELLISTIRALMTSKKKKIEILLTFNFHSLVFAFFSIFSYSCLFLKYFYL